MQSIKFRPSSIKISREKWINCIDQLLPLCQQVFQLEEARFTKLDLDFDADMYALCEELDQFHCLVMRKDGRAIGFHWVFITPMMRHKGLSQAHTDAIFVDPEYRIHSKQLIEFSNSYIAERADFWTLANLGVCDRQVMWQKQGFEPIETIMFKKIGELCHL